ncbi:MAG: hypothetical protein K9W45_02555 [Candidatus Heimdallarchaeum aukensis]|uniref:Uncharacterized protein n=1 Tax=Candidatus Heimdallarchaeum aukensis TaxID=2876573 RepID=A0A9Y1FL59_9ARCH|nr:MAG: hypothetical protein K9W45_02555 [Candidatus Heimdallarchaeum aukensis]
MSKNQSNLDTNLKQKKELNSEKKKSTKKNSKNKEKWYIRWSFNILSVFFAIISLIGSFILLIYDIFVPRTLRELVPILNMFRKYILIAAELFSGKKSKEVAEVVSELEEIKMKEEKIMKNYPIRRGIGEAINLGLHPVIIFAIPTAIWGKNLHQLFESWGIPVSLGILLFGTGLLCISWIATIFGPIYALFHECSIFMLKRGSYRWAEFFQDLENLFALPYYTARSSFSILDAPPISAETLEEFKLDIMDDIGQIKNRIADILSLDATQVPERSKQMLQELLIETQQSLGSINISEIKEVTARQFALLIWNKEGSMFPWRRNEALEEFAKKNNMSVKEAKKTIQLIAKKAVEGFTSKDLYFSIMITGALKGIAELEEKYKQFMSDIEYTSTALSLSLGAQQYIIDTFTEKPFYKKLLKVLVDSFIALFLPYIMLLVVIFKYFKHVVGQTIRNIVSIKDLKKKKIFRNKIKEIKETLYSSYHSIGDSKFSLKETFDIDFGEFFKKLGKFFVKVLLLVPLLFWSLIKAIYIRIQKLLRRRTEEEKNKRKFEKELATKTLVAMYEELYEKIVLSNLYYT